MVRKKINRININDEVSNIFTLLFETYVNPWITEKDLYLFKAIVFEKKNFTQVSEELKISTYTCRLLFNKIMNRVTNILEYKINILEIQYEGKIVELETKIIKLKNELKKYEVDINTHDEEDGIVHKVNLTLSDLNLSKKTYNLLSNRQINTVEQLIHLSETDLNGINQLGIKRIIEISDKLKDLGLSLASMSELKR
jgi:hypothetical protein